MGGEIEMQLLVLFHEIQIVNGCMACLSLLKIYNFAPLPLSLFSFSNKEKLWKCQWLVNKRDSLTAVNIFGLHASKIELGETIKWQIPY